VQRDIMWHVSGHYKQNECRNFYTCGVLRSSVRIFWSNFSMHFCFHILLTSVPYISPHPWVRSHVAQPHESTSYHIICQCYSAGVTSCI